MAIRTGIDLEAIRQKDEIFNMWHMLDKFAENAKMFYAYKGTLGDDITCFGDVNGKRYKITVTKIGD